MITISILLGLFYAITMIYFLKGWYSLKVHRNSHKGQAGVSVIIPARNEEGKIGKLLELLDKQNYSKDLYEVIVVDDHSEDGTSVEVETFQGVNVSLIKLGDILKSEDQIKSYKKKALEKGIEQARFELILTTDADCYMGNDWISSIVDYYENNNYRMIAGPVAYDEESGFFKRFQALDFLSMIGLGAASIGNHSPIVCNGANLLYEKDTFIQLNGFSGIDHIASGDDILLMHKLEKRYPGSIGFIKNRESIVYTQAEANLGGFLNQRKRWASKSFKYSDKKVTLILAGIYLFNLSILVNAIASFWYFELLYLALSQLAVKFIFDMLIVFPVTSFFRRKSLLWVFLPSQLLHIPYVLFIGIWSNWGSYTWKGRKVN